MADLKFKVTQSFTDKSGKQFTIEAGKTVQAIGDKDYKFLYNNETFYTSADAAEYEYNIPTGQYVVYMSFAFIIGLGLGYLLKNKNK